MKYKDFRYQVLSDLYRIEGSATYSSLIKELIFGESYKFSFWMRTCAYLKDKFILKLFFYLPAKLIYNHYTYKFGISIPLSTNIGDGFYIGHFGGIVVNGLSVIGDNCNISQGVTLGQSNRGSKKGYPTLGNDVYIGPGAKIVGAVNIGNNVAIGANCVVTKDIPNNSVVVGIPGKVISDAGAASYITRTDYHELIRSNS